MLNDVCNGSCSTSAKNENTPANNHVCDCNQNKVSEIIDADQERKAALLNSRKELTLRIADIAKEYEQRRDVVLAPLWDALTKTDELLEELDQPMCFGTYTCPDRDLENCPVKRSAACYRKVRGC